MNIQELLKRREKLGNELDKLDDAIDAIQDICDHEWVSASGGSDRYKVCDLCGAENWD